MEDANAVSNTTFKPGDRVVLSGEMQTEEMKSRHGTIFRHNPETGRYSVNLDAIPGNPKNILPEMLSLEIPEKVNVLETIQEYDNTIPPHHGRVFDYLVRKLNEYHGNYDAVEDEVRSQLIAKGVDVSDAEKFRDIFSVDGTKGIGAKNIVHDKFFLLTALQAIQSPSAFGGWKHMKALGGNFHCIQLKPNGKTYFVVSSNPYHVYEALGSVKPAEESIASARRFSHGFQAPFHLLPWYNKLVALPVNAAQLPQAISEAVYKQMSKVVEEAIKKKRVVSRIHSLELNENRLHSQFVPPSEVDPSDEEVTLVHTLAKLKSPPVADMRDFDSITPYVFSIRQIGNNRSVVIAGGDDQKASFQAASSDVDYPLQCLQQLTNVSVSESVKPVALVLDDEFAAERISFLLKDTPGIKVDFFRPSLRKMGESLRISCKRRKVEEDLPVEEFNMAAYSALSKRSSRPICDMDTRKEILEPFLNGNDVNAMVPVVPADVSAKLINVCNDIQGLRFKGKWKSALTNKDFAKTLCHLYPIVKNHGNIADPRVSKFLQILDPIFAEDEDADEDNILPQVAQLSEAMPQWNDSEVSSCAAACRLADSHYLHISTLKELSTLEPNAVFNTTSAGYDGPVVDQAIAFLGSIVSVGEELKARGGHLTTFCNQTKPLVAQAVVRLYLAHINHRHQTAAPPDAIKKIVKVVVNLVGLDGVPLRDGQFNPEMHPLFNELARSDTLLSRTLLLSIIEPFIRIDISKLYPNRRQGDASYEDMVFASLSVFLNAAGKKIFGKEMPLPYAIAKKIVTLVDLFDKNPPPVANQLVDKFRRSVAAICPETIIMARQRAVKRVVSSVTTLDEKFVNLIVSKMREFGRAKQELARAVNFSGTDLAFKQYTYKISSCMEEAGIQGTFLDPEIPIDGLQKGKNFWTKQELLLFFWAISQFGWGHWQYMESVVATRDKEAICGKANSFFRIRSYYGREDFGHEDDMAQAVDFDEGLDEFKASGQAITKWEIGETAQV